MVDDEPLVREVAKLALEGEGLSVITARDGREACHLVDTRDDIAAIVLDLTLPDLGVEEILRAIRARRPHVPVILSSGHHEQLATKDLEPAAAAFLQKPWHLSRLVQVVTELLAAAI